MVPPLEDMVYLKKKKKEFTRLIQLLSNVNGQKKSQQNWLIRQLFHVFTKYRNTFIFLLEEDSVII